MCVYVCVCVCVCEKRERERERERGIVWVPPRVVAVRICVHNDDPLGK